VSRVVNLISIRRHEINNVKIKQIKVFSPPIIPATFQSVAILLFQFWQTDMIAPWNGGKQLNGYMLFPISTI